MAPGAVPPGALVTVDGLERCYHQSDAYLVCPAITAVANKYSWLHFKKHNQREGFAMLAKNSEVGQRSQQET